MIGLPRVKVNGFNFDSNKPVQGIVRDEKRDEAINKITVFTIDYILAINVVLLGIWLCKWWVIGGGDYWADWLFSKLAPGFLTMVKYGQI